MINTIGLLGILVLIILLQVVLKRLWSKMGHSKSVAMLLAFFSLLISLSLLIAYKEEWIANTAANIVIVGVAVFYFAMFAMNGVFNKIDELHAKIK